MLRDKLALDERQNAPETAEASRADAREQDEKRPR
jgi:hypothetical protein